MMPSAECQRKLFGWKGRISSERYSVYMALDQKAIHAMRTAASFSMPLGNNCFEAVVDRQIGRAKRGGRPRRCLQD
jgi:hypothetical protein